MDALFSDRWWDYTNDFMNLNGRISIFFSFAWGFIALIFIHFVHPFIEKLTKKVLKKISMNVQIFFMNIIVSTWIVDTVLSTIKYLN